MYAHVACMTLPPLPLLSWLCIRYTTSRAVSHRLNSTHDEVVHPALHLLLPAQVQSSSGTTSKLHYSSAVVVAAMNLRASTGWGLIGRSVGRSVTYGYNSICKLRLCACAYTSFGFPRRVYRFSILEHGRCTSVRTVLLLWCGKVCGMHAPTPYASPSPLSQRPAARLVVTVCVSPPSKLPPLPPLRMSIDWSDTIRTYIRRVVVQNSSARPPQKGKKGREKFPDTPRAKHASTLMWTIDGLAG